MSFGHVYVWIVYDSGSVLDMQRHANDEQQLERLYCHDVVLSSDSRDLMLFHACSLDISHAC